MIDEITIGAGSVPTEEENLATLQAEAEKAPTSTEEALDTHKVESGTVSEEDVEEAPEAEVEDESSEEEPKEDAGEPEDKPEEGEGDEEETEPVTVDDLVFHLTERFAETEGQLSDEDYATAEQFGFSKDVVNAYISGQQAQQELANFKIEQAAGGRESLDAMLVWASTGLTSTEIAAYNAVMADSDVTKAVDGITELRQRYEAYYGTEPTLIGGKPPRSDVTSYGSWAEVTKDMSDPRYGRDAAFTAKVSQKLERSNPR